MSKFVKLSEWFANRFNTKRVFIKSNNRTTYMTIKPYQQISGCILIIILGLWTIISTSYIAIDTTYSKNANTQAFNKEQKYQERLNALASERDAKEKIATIAQQQFQTAIKEISKNQTSFLTSETYNKELNLAIKELQKIITKAEYQNNIDQKSLRFTDKNINTNVVTIQDTINFLSVALEKNGMQRELIAEENNELKIAIADLKHKALISTERAERIFSRLEEAVSVSISPLEKMFEDVGISTDKLLQDVRRGYSGTGGPLMPLLISKGHSSDTRVNSRANEILSNLDTLNLYRLAAFQTPFSHPLNVNYRFTSSFGVRTDPKNGRKQMHHGIDLAAYSGSKIHATADGTVTKAWVSGAYGKLIEIRHAMGYETRYAHLKKIRVKSGQRVARGDVIGNMGNTGRSTGTHLHYEIRKNGKAINPMKYIKAAKNVF